MQLMGLHERGDHRRDGPDVVRDELAARAVRAGRSMQEYLREMVIEAAARPPVEDVIARACDDVVELGVGERSP